MKAYIFKKSQTSIEFIIILSVVFIILMIAASVVLDFPSIVSNLSDSSHDRALLTDDIGILSHSFNSTHGKLRIINNLKDYINLSITINSTEVYSDLLLNPSEVARINFSYPQDIVDYYSVKLIFEYVNLNNNAIYGYSATVESFLD